MSVVAGKPDDSWLVLTCEGKGWPMPPKKWKKQPKAEEVARVRAWIAAGAKDDSAAKDDKAPKGEQKGEKAAAATSPVPSVDWLRWGSTSPALSASRESTSDE